MDPKSPSKLKLTVSSYKRICVVNLVILLVVGIYFVFNSGKTRDSVGRVDCSDCYYTVIVDCGSTGTRVNVYKWRRSVDNMNLPILLHSYPDNSSASSFSRDYCKYHCMQTEPGLDKFVGNATGVRVSLEPLILWAETWVPRERHRDTPIFVLATAGLRRLLTADAVLVLDVVEEVLKEHYFVYQRSWIRVLSGKEEAYYGWVALNYEMGILGNSSGGLTLGLLDLGGSSLQVVMEVDDGAKTSDKNLIRSRIGSIEHQIIAYSLPSFGLNEAFDRTVAMLSQAQSVVRSSDERLKLSHPCLGSHFMKNYSCYSCDASKATYQNDSSGEMHADKYLYLVGDPDWEQCRKIAKAAAINLNSLNWSQPADGNNFTDYWTDVTHHTGQFHALLGFFVVYNMLNLEPRANWTNVREKGHNLCLMSWTNLSRMSGNPYHLGEYCFRVPYIASLIEDGLCLGDKEIIFGPGNLSWTLGAALVEGEYRWMGNIDGSISLMTNFPVNYSPAFIFLLLLGLLFIVYRCQIKLPMPGRKVPAAASSFPSYNYPRRRAN